MIINHAKRILKLPSLKTLRTIATLSEEKIAVGDVQINYVRSGNGEKSVLLMPGAIGSAWTDFKPQIEQLPTLLPEYTIYAWDPPGYGKSIPPARDFSLDFYKTDALIAHKFMDALRVNKYSILGWSDGGVSAMIAAAKFSRFVEKIVIWGANSYITPLEVEQFKKIRDVSNFSPKARQTYEELYGAENFRKLWEGWVDAVLKIYAERNGDICKQLLDDIKCPTFILHGDLDPMLDKEHVPHLMKSINNAQLHRFPEGKHNIHLKYADEFNQLVAYFLSV